MTVEHQLAEWVKGNSLHNPTRKECCPDFSCCVPELKADQATREKFAAASPQERNAMLLGFLAASMRFQGYRVTTSGDALKRRGKRRR